jgi:hypothetical protein
MGKALDKAPELASRSRRISTRQLGPNLRGQTKLGVLAAAQDCTDVAVENVTLEDLVAARCRVS